MRQAPTLCGCPNDTCVCLLTGYWRRVSSLDAAGVARRTDVQSGNAMHTQIRLKFGWQRLGVTLR
jgi:hypothetical protein